MDWQEYIEQTDEIEDGRPVVKGSHLEVEFVLRQMAAGFTRKKILENYPVITKESYAAILTYAAEMVKEHSGSSS